MELKETMHHWDVEKRGEKIGCQRYIYIHIYHTCMYIHTNIPVWKHWLCMRDILHLTYICTNM